MKLLLDQERGDSVAIRGSLSRSSPGCRCAPSRLLNCVIPTEAGIQGGSSEADVCGSWMPAPAESGTSPSETGTVCADVTESNPCPFDSGLWILDARPFPPFAC